MEIRQIVRGKNTGFAVPPKAKAAESKTGGVGRPSADRLELSRQWVENMEEQRAQTEAALLTGSKEKKSNGILDLLDKPADEEQDALSKQLKTQQKCLKIAMNIMKGKKVPPEDEQYLMEHDPEGYKLAIAMRGIVREDDKECESVLDDEDKNGGETGETAPTDSAASGGEVAASSGEAE